MVITAADHYRGIVRISRARFIEVARKRFAPAVLSERDPGEYYDAIVGKGCDPAFILAIFQHESTSGRFGMATITRSWGNTKFPAFGPTPIGRIEDFAQYATWMDGCLSTVERLMTTIWYYAYEARTIGAVFNDPVSNDPGYRPAMAPVPRTYRIEWAPASDNNNPASYLSHLLADMNAISDQDGPPQARRVHIVLVAGHHNSAGGDALEIRQTGPLTRAIAAALRMRAGFIVTVLTPDDGMGTSSGDHNAVARQAVALDATHPVDCYLEVHTEGNGAGDAGRGCFVIYPDMNGDTDVDVRDEIGPALSRAVSAATGLPLRGNGLMSERNTGVGSQGNRLGVFANTAAIRGHCTRLIPEFGSHTSPADLEIMNRPEFPRLIGESVAGVLSLFYDITDTPPPPAVDPNARYFPATDKWMVNLPEAPVLAFYDAGGGVDAFGLPLLGMVQREDGVYEQLTENALIESYPAGFGPHPGPWVRLGGLGQRYLEEVNRG